MINFKPFVGSNYYNSIYGVKVLVLALSHYGSDESNYPNYTIDVVHEHAYKKGLAFFTKLTKVLRLSVDYPTDDERKSAWRNVAFYNYVQEIVSDEARVDPTNEMLDNAIEPFIAVYNELKPDVILVLGNLVWDNVPNLKGVEFCYISHPSSSALKYEEAFNDFKQHIEKAKQSINRKEC